MFTEEDRLQGLGTSLSSEEKSLESLDRRLFCRENPICSLIGLIVSFDHRD